MNEMKKFCKIFVLAAAFATALTACKKDDEENTKNYLTGKVAIAVDGYASFPAYVAPGDKFTLSASGVSAPDGISVKYYFTNPFTSSRDTLEEGKKYTFQVRDSLSTFSLPCTAFASNSSEYYTTSSSLTFVVVSSSPAKPSLTGLPNYEDESTEVLHDKKYTIATVGSTDWIRQNLAYVKDGFGTAYFNCPAMLDVFGAYYTWEEAQTACPSGWRLPSEADWVNLCKASGAGEAAEMAQIEGAAPGLMVYTWFNGSPMWEYYRGVDASDKTHFSSIPTGYATLSGDSWSFYGYKQYAAYWTSAEKDGEGVYRYIYKDKDIVYVGTAPKTGFAASVRCVR